MFSHFSRSPTCDRQTNRHGQTYRHRAIAYTELAERCVVKTNLDFTEARDSEWQWHQLGHMQVCTLMQTDYHASTPPLSFLQAGCPSCCPTNSIEALKAKTCSTLTLTIWLKNATICSHGSLGNWPMAQDYILVHHHNWDKRLEKPFMITTPNTLKLIQKWCHCKIKLAMAFDLKYVTTGNI